MASKRVNELPDASTPILGTDIILVSRDGINVNKTSLNNIPISNQIQTILDNKVTGQYNTNGNLTGLVDKNGNGIELGYPDEIYFCRCPMIYHGSGTINNNGGFVLSSPLTRVYPRAYLYFPANVIGLGVPAGWYYCTFTNSTSGTVFNNVYTTGNVSFPVLPTPFTTNGVGNFSNPLSIDIPGFNFNLLGGSLGNNGILRMQGFAVANNSASVKNLTPMFDSTVASQFTLTNAQWFSFNTPIVNMGEQTRQALPRQNTGGEGVGVGTNSDLNTMTNTDLSINRNFNFKFNISSSSDFLVLHYLNIIITRIE